MNDWRWVHGVNVMGVVHGILSFVPRMIASGEPGYVVNTSSGDGGIAPMPTASVYAASKAAVTSLTECLALQLVSEGTELRAGIFYPSGGLLRTGLWTADRNRRPSWPASVPGHRGDDHREARGDGRGRRPRAALAGPRRAGPGRRRRLRAERFIMMIGVESIGDTMRERAAAFETGSLPGGHAGLLG